MSRILLTKIKEALISVIPVVAIVLILYFTPLVSLTQTELLVFIICAFLLILGIGLFNLGADLAMTPMGEHIGAGLSRSGNLLLLTAVCFAMGLLITVAEPDLSVLAGQVAGAINGTLLIASVGVGVGIFLVISVLKIVFGKSLSSLLLFFYMLMFAVAALVIINGNESFLALAFDSGGVTTGPITVPFIMALGVGIAVTLGGKHVGENSFGLIALCSVGPILAVMILGIGTDSSSIKIDNDYSLKLNEALSTIGAVVGEVILALGMILLFFAVLQIFVLKLPKRKLIQIGVGIIYTFLGLVIFLSAVNIGFVPIGYKLGVELATHSHPALVVIFGIVLGAVVVLAEPAVHVLKKQVEDITERTVTKRSMMIALSCGVGISIGLSMLRIILDFNILYYIIPGYFISLGLSFFVPAIYTAIAFDSGGVASGPLTSSFILPLAVGVCSALYASDATKIMQDAFGVVAMVAMTPLITIQILGFRAIVAQKVRTKVALKAILSSDDEQIIDFM